LPTANVKQGSSSNTGAFFKDDLTLYIPKSELIQSHSKSSLNEVFDFFYSLTEFYAWLDNPLKY